MVSQWAPTAAVLIAATGFWYKTRRFQSKDFERKVCDTATVAARRVVNDFHQPGGICADKFFPKNEGTVLMTEMKGVREDIKDMKRDLHEGMSRTHKRIDELHAMVKANGSRK